MILDLPITNRNASVLCQCTCLHIAVNMIAFYVKRNENIYPKGRALMKMYRVVPQTKRERINIRQMYSSPYIYAYM